MDRDSSRPTSGPLYASPGSATEGAGGQGTMAGSPEGAGTGSANAASGAGQRERGQTAHRRQASLHQPQQQNQNPTTSPATNAPTPTPNAAASSSNVSQATPASTVGRTESSTNTSPVTAPILPNGQSDNGKGSNAEKPSATGQAPMPLVEQLAGSKVGPTGDADGYQRDLVPLRYSFLPSQQAAAVGVGMDSLNNPSSGLPTLSSGFEDFGQLFSDPLGNMGDLGDLDIMSYVNDVNEDIGTSIFDG